MVGLQMVDDQVIGFAAVQRFCQAHLPGLALAGVDGVQDGHLLVEDQVGIVSHALGHDILAFKEIEVEVIDADVFDGFVQGLDHFGSF